MVNNVQAPIDLGVVLICAMASQQNGADCPPETSAIFATDGVWYCVVLSSLLPPNDPTVGTQYLDVCVDEFGSEVRWLTWQPDADPRRIYSNL